MRTETVAVALLLCIPGYSADAAIYKCSANGATTYQSTPCEPGTDSTTVQLKSASTFEGCYEATFAAWESGKPQLESFRIRFASNGTPEMLSLETHSITGKPKKQPAIPMKRATAQELRDLGRAFHATFFEGLSIAGDAHSTPNYKPAGIYRVKDKDGKEFLFAYFFLSNGIARKIPCPG